MIQLDIRSRIKKSDSDTGSSVLRNPIPQRWCQQQNMKGIGRSDRYFRCHYKMAAVDASGVSCARPLQRLGGS